MMYGNKDGNYGVKPVSTAKAAGANLVESKLNKGGDTNWKGSRKGKGSSHKKGMSY